MSTNRDPQEIVREALEDMSPQNFHTLQLKAINKHLGWQIEQSEWEERAELLREGGLLNRIRYFRQALRVPWDLEEEIEYAEQRVETAAENVDRWQAAREELDEYEAIETVRRVSDR